MLQMMYLLSRAKSEEQTVHRRHCRVRSPEWLLAGFLLLIFPLMRLKMRWRIGAIMAIPALVFIDYVLTSAGITTRVASIASPASGLAGAVLDTSFNIRLGHISFTLIGNLLEIDSHDVSRPS